MLSLTGNTDRKRGAHQPGCLSSHPTACSFAAPHPHSWPAHSCFILCHASEEKQMSQQSIWFLSSETATCRKQQPARDWPRLSSDLFKEAIHTFSPRRGLPWEVISPSTEMCLWVFHLRFLSWDTAWALKPQYFSLCSPPMLQDLPSLIN